MTHDERAFLAGIAAHPDADLPRLVFADWLDENGQPDRAEYIRRAIAFDPHRDRFDDPALNEERRALTEVEIRMRMEWKLPFIPKKCAKHFAKSPEDCLHLHVGIVKLEFRRGFIDCAQVTAQAWIKNGRQIRELYPTLRKVVIFRMAGVGSQLAASETLVGIRELELACWYSDADAQAMANSPHIADVERLTLWGDYDHRQGLIFARSQHLPKLSDLHLVSDVTSSPDEWVGPANAAAGRRVASVYDFGKELYHFAPSFYGPGFIIGRMPDGVQVFAIDHDRTALHGIRFEPDGRIQEPFRFAFPDELQRDSLVPSEGALLRKRAAYFRERTGFTPAFIKVEQFSIDEIRSGPNRVNGLREYWDHSEPAGTHYLDPGGYGEAAYRYVRSRSYEYHHGDCIWWCDGRGEVHST